MSKKEKKKKKKVEGEEKAVTRQRSCPRRDKEREDKINKEWMEKTDVVLRAPIWS